MLLGTGNVTKRDDVQWALSLGAQISPHAHRFLEFDSCLNGSAITLPFQAKAHLKPRPRAFAPSGAICLCCWSSCCPCFNWAASCMALATYRTHREPTRRMCPKMPVPCVRPMPWRAARLWACHLPCPHSPFRRPRVSQSPFPIKHPSPTPISPAPHPSGTLSDDMRRLLGRLTATDPFPQRG